MYYNRHFKQKARINFVEEQKTSTLNTSENDNNIIPLEQKIQRISAEDFTKGQKFISPRIPNKNQKHKTSMFSKNLQPSNSQIFRPKQSEINKIEKKEITYKLKVLQVHYTQRPVSSNEKPIDVKEYSTNPGIKENKKVSCVRNITFKKLRIKNPSPITTSFSKNYRQNSNIRQGKNAIQPKNLFTSPNHCSINLRETKDILNLNVSNNSSKENSKEHSKESPHFSIEEDGIINKPNAMSKINRQITPKKREKINLEEIALKNTKLFKNSWNKNKDDEDSLTDTETHNNSFDKNQNSTIKGFDIPIENKEKPPISNIKQTGQKKKKLRNSSYIEENVHKNNIPFFECKLLTPAQSEDDCKNLEELFQSIRWFSGLFFTVETCINERHKTTYRGDKVYKSIASFLDLKSLACFTLCVEKKYFSQIRRIFYQEIFDIITNEKKIKTHKDIKRSLLEHSSIPSKEARKVYGFSLYQKCSLQLQLQIEKDIPRTILDDKSFKKGGSNFKKLGNLLTAYSNYNEKIGYAQGLNFLVGYSMYFFKEEFETFVFVDAMIRKFGLEKLYGKFNSLRQELDELGNFLKKFVSEVLQFLQDNYLSHEFFTANWLITLFSNGMRRENLSVVWDLMIVLGWRFFKFFVASLIKFYEKQILKSEPSQLSFLMKNLLKRSIFQQDFKTIIGNTFELMSKNYNE